MLLTVAFACAAPKWLDDIVKMCIWLWPCLTLYLQAVETWPQGATQTGTKQGPTMRLSHSLEELLVFSSEALKGFVPLELQQDLQT